MGSLLFTSDQLTKELKRLKKKTCIACEANLRFFKDLLSGADAEKSRLTRVNESLIREIEGLLNANGDLRLKLREAENRTPSESFSQHTSRDPFYWSQCSRPPNQYLMTLDERRSNLLRPNPPN